ncbi:MAG: hypothetical protein U0136_12720 [Bdellovibrionota bacterium]
MELGARIVSAKKMWGRLVVQYYELGDPEVLACPDCGCRQELQLERRPLSFGPAEIQCPRCRLPLAMVSSQLVDEFASAELSVQCAP